MWPVYTCLVFRHDLTIVGLAAVVCAAGCWAVVDLFHHGLGHSGFQRLGWLFLTALTAGCSIWCTHFVAILAFEPGVPVTFEPVLTMASLLVAAVGTGLGFAVAASGESRLTPVLGGIVVGAGISAMHYSGMRAYVLEGIVHWNKGYVIASIVIAVTFSALAMHFATRRGGFRDKYAATALLFLGIVGLHFTGMTALRISPPMIFTAMHFETSSRDALALTVAAVSFLVIGMGFVSHLIESGARAEAERRLRRSELNDSLTGLPNRAAFLERLRREIRVGGRIALITIDLDRFSEINDQCGHAAGDAALIEYARRMAACLRGDEFVARLGADEFSALERLRGEMDPSELLSRLMGAFNGPARIADRELSISASFGIAVYPEHAGDEETLINNADLALSRSKARRFDKISFYDPSMDDVIRTRRRLAAELGRAIANNQLEVFYQPQVSVATGAVTGYEALLRWKHPSAGYIPPNDFIALAEENGSILPIGEWVLAKACADAASWIPLRKVAVNISPVQFSHPDLPALVRRILTETGLRAERLELELTESTLIANKSRSLEVLLRLKAMGATIAIDDFGTGYSSLDTLRSFPFDRIKLDRSFVREIETSRQAKAIFRAVVALGDSLGVTVLAEGVETEGQAELLKVKRCGEAQGYLYGRPAPLADLVASGALSLKSSTTAYPAPAANAA
jgi:diguanylate cyclase (GGDEF)-like protein